MTRMAERLERQTDDDLLTLARMPDSSSGAMGELYRRHAPVARRVARGLLNGLDGAEDVVNDAFAGVMAAMANGKGPTTNFSHYLIASVRNNCRRRKRPTSVLDDEALDRNGVADESDRLSEAVMVEAAFSSLSPEWRRTLWLSEVEGQSTAEVARQLGRRPGAVAALSKRARDGFAEAYLAQHQRRPHSPDCARVAPSLARYVRRRVGPIERGRVDRHLARCAYCRNAVDELRDLNASLRSMQGAGLLAETIAILGSSTALDVGATTAVSTGGVLGGLTGAVVAKTLLVASVVVPATIGAVAAVDHSPRAVRMRSASASTQIVNDQAAIDATVSASGLTPQPGSVGNGD